MPSRYVDARLNRRHAELRYELNRRSLSGRVVLVVGGTGGLGAAVTAHLLTDGALPVVAYRHNRGRALVVQQRAQDVYGGLVTLVEADVDTEAGRQRCLQAALNVKGELYGAVLACCGSIAEAEANRAAKTAPRGSGCVPMARACAEQMVRASVKGAIVFLSEGIGPAPPSLLRATRAMAREYGGVRDIRVNLAVAGLCTAGQARAAIEKGQFDARIESGAIPRFGRPEDVARAVRFLLEPDGYVTGQLLSVDGGLGLTRG